MNPPLFLSSCYLRFKLSSKLSLISKKDEESISASSVSSWCTLSPSLPVAVLLRHRTAPGVEVLGQEPSPVAATVVLTLFRND